MSFVFSALGVGCAGSVSPPADCVVAADCDLGFACVNGACVATTGDVDAGDVTIGDGDGDGDGDCTIESELTDCGASGYCIDGACAERPLCGPAGECPDGLACNPIENRCARPVECEGPGCDCSADTCDDGLFCNGTEACVDGTGCLAGASPCGGATPACDEATDRCLECVDASDCDGAPCVDERCACVPDCAGRVCGDDGCGGSCGSCGGGELCADDGTCGCVPDCGGRVCGTDGCGGSCGSCTAPDTCIDGFCECVPQCTGQECGPDGCGGTCGGCEANETCTSGTCTCVPQCTGKQCGTDGCGGSCGACESFEACNASGQCVVDGEVCDYFFDPDVLSAFGTVNANLTAADELFEWDARPPRRIDNFGVLATKESTSVLTLTSTVFDTYLYVYRVDGGQCTQVAKNDDVVTGDTDSSLSITISDTGLYEIVVSSFAGDATGAYTLSSTTDLCGLDIDAATYAKCAPIIAAQANPCQNNPCLPDTPTPNDEFCCITANCRSGYGTGTTIQVFSSTPICGN